MGNCFSVPIRLDRPLVNDSSLTKQGAVGYSQKHAFAHRADRRRSVDPAVTLVRIVASRRFGSPGRHWDRCPPQALSVLRQTAADVHASPCQKPQDDFGRPGRYFPPSPAQRVAPSRLCIRALQPPIFGLRSKNFFPDSSPPSPVTLACDARLLIPPSERIAGAIGVVSYADLVQGVPRFTGAPMGTPLPPRGSWAELLRFPVSTSSSDRSPPGRASGSGSSRGRLRPVPKAASSPV